MAARTQYTASPTTWNVVGAKCKAVQRTPDLRGDALGVGTLRSLKGSGSICLLPGPDGKQDAHRQWPEHARQWCGFSPQFVFVGKRLWPKTLSAYGEKHCVMAWHIPGVDALWQMRYFEREPVMFHPGLAHWLPSGNGCGHHRCRRAHREPDVLLLRAEPGTPRGPHGEKKARDLPIRVSSVLHQDELVSLALCPWIPQLFEQGGQIRNGCLMCLLQGRIGTQNRVVPIG